MLCLCGFVYVLAGYDGGTRVESMFARQTYGQFQVRARIPCSSGVVSAFYVSANDCQSAPVPIAVQMPNPPLPSSLEHRQSCSMVDRQPCGFWTLACIYTYRGRVVFIQHRTKV